MSKEFKNQSLFKNIFYGKPARNRNQSTALHCKSFDWFPHKNPHWNSFFKQTILLLSKPLKRAKKYKKITAVSANSPIPL